MEFKKLQKIIAEVLGIGDMEIFQEMSFVDDLGADSLELFQILMGVEQEFDISIEEESLKELEAKNAKFIHFCVSDAQKAAKIIAATFHSKDFRLTDANNLYLYDMTLPVERINRSFVESGIEIQEVHLCEDTLEDYFKKITGGEGIA